MRQNVGPRDPNPRQWNVKPRQDSVDMWSCGPLLPSLQTRVAHPLRTCV